MVYSSLSLGYAELRSALRETYRSRRRWYWRNRIHKGLLEACVHFTRNGLRIVNKMVIARLHVALKELGIINRRLSFFLDGEAKAMEMKVKYNECGVFRWAPRLKQWLDSDAYKFWLGTIQRSLENFAYPLVEVGSCQPRG